MLHPLLILLLWLLPPPSLAARIPAPRICRVGDVVIRRKAPKGSPPLLHPLALTKCHALVLDAHERVLDTELTSIFSALPRSAIVKLHLLHTPLTIPNVARLAAAVAQSQALRVVHLHNLELEDAGVTILCRALLDNPRLTDITLSQNHFIGIQTASMGLDLVAARALRKLLVEHPSLMMVDFRGTRLGTHGVAAVASAIQNNRHRLIGVNLQQTGINATGAGEIADALLGSGLLHLDLSGNLDVGDEGARAFGWALSRDDDGVRLKELDLSGCGLTDLGAIYLAEALDINRQLHHLLLHDNLQLTGDGVEEFLRVLRQDDEFSNMEIGSIELTRPPIDHTNRRAGASHHHDHQASRRLLAMMDALEKLLERNRLVKEKKIGSGRERSWRHPHYPHHPRKLWKHEGNVAGDLSIVSLDGEKAHLAPPKGLETDRRVPLPHESAPYQPIQGGVQGIMERVKAGNERSRGEL